MREGAARFAHHMGSGEARNRLRGPAASSLSVPFAMCAERSAARDAVEEDAARRARVLDTSEVRASDTKKG